MDIDRSGDRSFLLALALTAAGVAVMVGAAALVSGPGSAPAAVEKAEPPPATEAWPAPPDELPPDFGKMALVPAGWFFMGADEGVSFEGPRHRVYLDAFEIDLYEVTNYQYAQYVRATGAAPPPHWKEGRYRPGRALHPVTNVTVEEAQAYARWAGKRLPTEAEWEKACGGIDSTRYAYGDAFDATLCNSGYSSVCDTVPVGRYPDGVSFYGCFDMTGNVWEWVSDWFSKTYYEDGQKNPTGPPVGTHHVSKGGSWTTDEEACQTSFRCWSLPGARWGYCGFRCARTLPPVEGFEKPGVEDLVRIPAGSFLLGQDGHPFSGPQRRVHLDAFLVDRVPVTNRAYKVFCEATGHPAPPHWHAGWIPEGREDHPVINVSLDDARAYARWAGKRLLTEAEWEKAARGTDGRRYPWGETFDAAKGNTYETGIADTVPVGSYPAGASPYGVLDMCGNVWEWVEGPFTRDGYERYAKRNPEGPRGAFQHVLRGGTWSTFPVNCQTFSRCMALPGCRWGYTGFRCAKDAE